MSEIEFGIEFIRPDLISASGTLYKKSIYKGKLDKSICVENVKKIKSEVLVQYIRDDIKSKIEPISTCKKTRIYRIYPTKSQIKKLENHLNVCRLVYNNLLEACEYKYSDTGTVYSEYDMDKILTGYKKENRWLYNYESHILTNISKRIDLAYKAYFRRMNSKNPKFPPEEWGKPKFKKYGTYESFTTDIFKLSNGRISILNIGELKLSPKEDVAAKPLALTISKYNDCKWYAYISMRFDCDKSYEKTEKSVGIDLGLIDFATFSDDRNSISGFDFISKDEKDLARVNRNMSEIYEWSKKNKIAMREHPKYDKYRKILVKIHRRIKNRRNDKLHNVSHTLVKEYDKLVLEELDIKKMILKSKNAKSINDSSWGKFINLCEYKMREKDGEIVYVNPYNTSKKCNICGYIKEDLQLKDREWDCPSCNTHHNRDKNAAINIAKLGGIQ